MRRLSMLAALVVALAPLALVAQALVKGNWSVNHTPLVSARATISKAAGSGSRVHVATGCSGSITTTTTQTGITLSLRDGASDAGTVLWSQTIACATGTPCVLASGLINAIGTAATAMTCEWSGVPVATNYAVATLSGYTVGG